MKFNWGHGIAIFLAIFLLSMAFVVYKAFQQDNSLVEKEYYPKGLEYQKQIDRVANVKELGRKIELEEISGKIILHYPEFFKNTDVQGSIFFYRPSDDAGDVQIPIQPDSLLTQHVDTRQLMIGKYIVKINWKMAAKEYYQEETLYIKH